MDFISSFLEDASYNSVLICIDKLTKPKKLLPYYVEEGELSALVTAKLFFENIVYLYGCSTSNPKQQGSTLYLLVLGGLI